MHEWLVETVDVDDRAAGLWLVATYDYINDRSALADAVQAAASLLGASDAWKERYDYPVEFPDLIECATPGILNACGIWRIERTYPTLIYMHDEPLLGQEGF